MGKLDSRQSVPRMAEENHEQEQVVAQKLQRKMRLGSIVNLTDFEIAASQRLSARAYACGFHTNRILSPLRVLT